MTDTRVDTVETEAAEPRTPFDALGGHAAIRAVVERFYDLMDRDPAYAELRAMHAPDLAPMRASLAGFLAGWSGGPRDWFEANPGKCMMSMHSRFAISGKVARQWSDAMRRAIEGAGIANPRMAEEFAGVMERLAMGMARD